MTTMDPPRRVSDRRYVRALGAYGREVGRVMASHMRDVVLGVQLAAARGIAVDAEGGELDDEGRPVDHMAGAGAAFWSREARRGAAMAAKVPTPERIVASEADRIIPATVRSQRAAAIRAGARRDLLALRVGVEAGEVLGVDMRLTAAELAIRDQWVASNLRLIRTVPERLTRDWADWISEAVVEGRTYRQILDGVQARAGNSESDAERIARDQVNKAQAQIQQSFAREIGSDTYAWIDVGDGRERDSHAEVADRYWRFSDPPEGTGPYGEPANPGEAIQCRCRARIWIPPELTGGAPANPPERGSPV